MPRLSLVPDLAQLRLATLDGACIVPFAAATVGHHGFSAPWTRRHPLQVVKGKLARTWVERVVDRDERVLAVQAVRNRGDNRFGVLIGGGPPGRGGPGRRPAP